MVTLLGLGHAVERLFHHPHEDMVVSVIKASAVRPAMWIGFDGTVPDLPQFSQPLCIFNLLRAQ